MTKAKIFKALPWIVPVALAVGFYLPATSFFAPLIIALFAVVAAGVAKLLFPRLFDDVFTEQKTLLTHPSRPEWNAFQIGRFMILWWTFFAVWCMLNVLKLLG